MGSAPRKLDKSDIVKGASAFAWNLSSLLIAIAIAVLTLPTEELPEWLLWVVPIAPLLNTVLYTAKRWLADNRR